MTTWVPLLTVTLFADISECHRAQDVLKKMKIPEPCRKIKDIEFGFTLSNDWWSGTKDDIGATISGPAGKAEFVITEQPSRGESKWVPVNMQESFKSDSIDITGINNLTLTAETFFLRGPQSDQFKVQGESKQKEMDALLLTNDSGSRYSTPRKMCRSRL